MRGMIATVTSHPERPVTLIKDAPNRVQPMLYAPSKGGIDSLPTQQILVSYGEIPLETSVNKLALL